MTSHFLEFFVYKLCICRYSCTLIAFYMGSNIAAIKFQADFFGVFGSCINNAISNFVFYNPRHFSSSAAKFSPLFQHLHKYLWINPAASSDVILLLRDNLEPGAENGRPLTPLMDNFWQLDDNYLKDGAPAR